MKNITLTRLSLEDLRQMFREEISAQANNLSKSSSNSSASKELLRPAEACLYLKIARSTLYNMVYKRAIPHMKKGKKLYFDKEELNEWVLSGRKLT
jgi:excisionase family DNA binding protein